jgi:hypothetical protein
LWRTPPDVKTILPHKAAVKLDLRLIPGLTAAASLDALKSPPAKAWAANEYYVIESANPKIQGIVGAIRAQVEYLYELAV